MARHRRASRDQAPGLWDRPEALAALADILFFAAGLVLAYAAVMTAARLSAFPVRVLEISAPLSEVSRAEIEAAARKSLQGNMLTVDLDALRAALEAVPWVRRADLRRHWPSAVEVRIEEHVAAANWRQLGSEQTPTSLVNTHGEVFNAEPRRGLPDLAGPYGSSKDVLQRYHSVAQAFTRHERAPVAVMLSPRLAWQIRLDDGMLLEVGRDHEGAPTAAADGAQPSQPAPRALTAERLMRFVEAYPEVFRNVQADEVDLRYPNGFALRNARERKGTETKGKKG